MKIPPRLQSRLLWLNLPATLLISLLQRGPALRLEYLADRLIGSAPLGALLRSAFVGTSTFGAYHTLAGATELASSSPSPFTTTVGANVMIAFSIVGTTSGADSWLTSGSVPGLSFSGESSETLVLSGKPTTPGTYTVTMMGNDAIGGSTSNYSYTIVVTGASTVAPAITNQPTSVSVNVGGGISLSATATGTPSPTFQWMRNGRPIAGATTNTYTKGNTQPADAGLYSVVATNAGGSVSSVEAVVGVQTAEFFVGGGFSDPAWRTLEHPNGNLYSQILLSSASATVTADPGKVTRLSFVDLQDDIVQLEFSGPGSMTVTLDNSSGPTLPIKYNQNVQYMRGHATVVIQGAGANTFFSAFSVGSLTAVNQALFKGDVTYDGHADLARLIIQSPSGQFGGLFMGNAAFNDTAGTTGIYAPGVSVLGNIRVHDLIAFDDANPMLVFGSTPNAENGLRILGGDLQQANSRAVEVRGINKILMSAGTDSHNRFEIPQTNKAKLENAGADVTNSVIVNP